MRAGGSRSLFTRFWQEERYLVGLQFSAETGGFRSTSGGCYDQAVSRQPATLTKGLFFLRRKHVNGTGTSRASPADLSSMGSL